MIKAVDRLMEHFSSQGQSHKQIQFTMTLSFSPCEDVAKADKVICECADVSSESELQVISSGTG